MELNKSFQELEIDFAKASKELIYSDFANFDELRNSNNYVHMQHMDTALTWLSKYQEKHQSAERIHNIFSIIGDRGTGKSSFMETLKKAVDSGGFSPSEGRKTYTLPTIDPNIFDNTISMIEFFVVVLKTEVEKLENNSKKESNYFLSSDNDLFFIDFNSQVREIIEVLKTMRVDKSVFATNKSGLEVLVNIQEKNRFESSIEDLISSFLRLVNSNSKGVVYTEVALLIDDLDLVENDQVYNALQQIFKFLQYQSNLVVFISYREKQLTDSVMDHLIVSNKELLANKLVDLSELSKQCASFLEKGLPRYQRVYLSMDGSTSIYSLLHPFINQRDIANFDYLKSTNIDDFIIREVMRQTRISIKPVDGYEMTKFTLPKTLRSYLQYLQILYEMGDYNGKLTKADNNLERCKLLEILAENVNKYSSFFISNLKDVLNNKQKDIIDGFLDLDTYSKNSFIVKMLLDLIIELKRENTNEGNTDEIDTLVKISRRDVYNVTLGDVFQAITTFKNRMTEELSYHFIYSLKVLYSIEMLLQLIKTITKVENFIEERNIDLSNRDEINEIFEESCISEYMELNRGMIMPSNFWYNKFSNSNENDLSREDKNFMALLYVYPQNLEGQFAKRRYLYYTDIAKQGDVRHSSSTVIDYSNANIYYRFREITLKNDFKVGTSYDIDFYSALSDKTYVQESILSIITTEEPRYLFYSMFDIDIYVRKGYSRQSQANASDAFKHTIGRINDIFINNLNTRIEKYNRLSMIAPILQFMDLDSIYKYSPLFSENVVECILTQSENSSIENSNAINVFIQRFESNDDIYSSEFKDFFRNYKREYLDWPIDMNEWDKKRLDELIVLGSRHQIKDREKEYAQILINEIRSK